MGVVAVAVGVVVALFFVLRENEERGSDATTPDLPTITIEDGQPVGGVRRLAFTAGERIAFEVELEETATPIAEISVAPG